MSVVRTSLALTFVLASACGGDKVVAKAPPAAQAPVAKPVVQALPPRPLVAVKSFDCTSSLPEKQGETLRTRSSEGWREGALHCDVALDMDCRAKPEVTIEVGAQAQKAPLTLIGTDRLVASAVLPPRVWRAALDGQQLALSAKIAGACAEGDPKQGTPFALSDGFIASLTP